MTMLTLTIFLSTLALFAFGQNCPSDDYTECAGENGICDIPDWIDEGYMSYGQDGRWTLVPFTNDHTDGTDIRIRCNNDLGDIIPKYKHCCYKAAGTGFRGNWVSHKKENDANGWYMDNANAVWSMRYGTGSRFTHRVMAGKARGYCKNYFFADPAPGVGGKFCNAMLSAPAAAPKPNDAAWKICGNEGEDCKDLDRNAAQWVMYGDNDYYLLRLVISSQDGRIPCGNWFFEDPIKTGKHCWRAPAEYTFSDINAHWEVLRSCPGCASTEYTMGFGVTKFEEETISKEFTWELSAEISAGFSFGPADVGVAVGPTVSETVAHTIKSSLEQSYHEESTVTCKKGRLFQYVTEAKLDNGIESTDFSVFVTEYLCLDLPLTPQCPPGFCADDNCQKCTWDMTVLEHLGWSPSNVLGECQGDCDSDDDCESGLKCYHNEIPPGCFGVMDHSLYDYCGNAFANAAAEPIQLNSPAQAETVLVNEWSLVDWYHAHYQALVVFLVSAIVVLCGLTLCLMVRSRGSNNTTYAAVKYMGSETEMNV